MERGNGEGKRGGEMARRVGERGVEEALQLRLEEAVLDGGARLHAPDQVARHPISRPYVVLGLCRIEHRPDSVEHYGSDQIGQIRSKRCQSDGSDGSPSEYPFQRSLLGFARC